MPWVWVAIDSSIAYPTTLPHFVSWRNGAHEEAFWGSMAMERDSLGMPVLHRLCRICVTLVFLFEVSFPTALLESSRGTCGGDVVPVAHQQRIAPGEWFRWLFMSELFAFDPIIMPERRLYSHTIAECCTVNQCYQALEKTRKQLQQQELLRATERLVE